MEWPQSSDELESFPSGHGFLRNVKHCRREINAGQEWMIDNTILRQINFVKFHKKTALLG